MFDPKQPRRGEPRASAVWLDADTQLARVGVFETGSSPLFGINERPLLAELRQTATKFAAIQSESVVDLRLGALA
jgi:hypothetical protein